MDEDFQSDARECQKSSMKLDLTFITKDIPARASSDNQSIPNDSNSSSIISLEASQPKTSPNCNFHPLTENQKAKNIKKNMPHLNLAAFDCNSFLSTFAASSFKTSAGAATQHSARQNSENTEFNESSRQFFEKYIASLLEENESLKKARQLF